MHEGGDEVQEILQDVEEWHFDDGTGKADISGKRPRPQVREGDYTRLGLCDDAGSQMMLAVQVTAVLTSASGYHLIGRARYRGLECRVEAVVNTSYPQLDGVKLMVGQRAL